MEQVSFSLTDILDDVARQVGSVAGGRRAGNLFAVAKGVPDNLTGDPASLGRVLADLIETAFECAGTGKVAVGVDVVGDGTDPAEHSVALRFTVRWGDAGLTRKQAASFLSGFSSASQSKQENPDADGSPGAGDLADRIRGRIAVASETGKGFTVSLTAELGTEPDTAGDSERPAGFAAAHDPRPEISLLPGLERLRGARILLVEDHPINQTLTRDILVQVGCNVDVAEDGQQAVSAVRDRPEPYDAVIMDVQMPVMDGFEATRVIRDELSKTDLPIIAMTAYVLGDERKCCLAAGMNDYVAKPIHIPDLYATLIRWIEPGERTPGQAGEPAMAAERDHTKSHGTDVYLPDRIAGVDLDTGLARAMGNRGLYAGLLTQFAKTNEELGKDLGGAIADGDLDTARFLVHGLGSTAGNMGADELYLDASELEKAIVARSDDIDRLFDAFLGRLDGVLNAIRQSGTSPRSQLHALGRGNTPIDLQEASALATRFMAMLDDQDMEVHDHLDKLLEIFGGHGQDEQLKRLEESLEALEFPEAREILAGICKEILA